MVSCEIKCHGLQALAIRINRMQLTIMSSVQCDIIPCQVAPVTNIEQPQQTFTLYMAFLYIPNVQLW